MHAQLVVQGGPGTLATVESTALAGKPIVVLVDSGGAATALHKYCTQGLEAVEPKFQAHKEKLESIKSLNDSYGGKQLLFFSLEARATAAGGHLIVVGATPPSRWCAPSPRRARPRPATTTTATARST